MIKLKDIVPGKVYTFKDNPPFQVNEGLKRFKVYVSGEKEPLILLGKNEKDVKQTAHAMIQNSSVKIRKVVKEGILKESFQKRHFLNLIKQEIESLKGQIAYAKDKVRYKGTPDWEKKEFAAILKDKIKDLKDTEKHYKRVEKLKEGKLTEAGSLGQPISGGFDLGGNYYASPERKTEKPQDHLQGYSTKEAKNVIDGQLRMWAKELRKVQYKVIKDWMTAAKSGAIDYFDLVRGLKTGDIARAHPYEVRFLESLLGRDKIVDRFRSYFKGKKGKESRTKPRAKVG